MDDRKAEASTLLAGLSLQLKGGGFEIEANNGALRAADSGSGGQAVNVTCEPRPDDAGTLWFFGDGAPLAEADQPVTAVVAIRGILAGDGAR